MSEESRADDVFMTLFETASRLPPADRKEYLASACPDPSLVDELLRSLHLHDRMGGFLTEPVIERLDLQPPFQAGQLAAGRFRIVREIGEGGMGIVYEAIDEKLDLRRAIKCAKAGFRSRLPAEARKALRITHENVCRVYEIHTGECSYAPVDFLTMELLDGRPLSEVLAEKQQLDASQARDIAIQIGSGLDAAHKQGILHRDLKPNNVMITQTASGQLRVVITDFGLAQEPATEACGYEQQSSLRGVAQYIAPELLSGERASQASDIYSFGAILHEMLTGEAPPAPGSPLRALPTRWKGILARCLQPDPASRYGTVDALLTDLRGASTGRKWIFAAAAPALLGIYLLVQSALPEEPPVRLALLPFVQSDAASPVAQITGGALHDLSSRLEAMRLRGRKLIPIPLRAASEYGVSAPALAAARLGATHCLQGSIRPSPGGFFLHAELLDLETRTKVRDFSANYAISQAGAVPGALQGVITAGLSLSVISPLDAISPPAYVPYAEGMFHLRGTAPNADLAIPLFEHAIEIDPKSVLPYAGLAEACLTKFGRTQENQWLERGRDAVKKAESINPDSIALRLVAGQLYRVPGWHDRSIEEFQRVLKLDPNNAKAWRGLAMTFEEMPARRSGAAAALEKAIQLEPGYYANYLESGSFYRRIGDYEAAERNWQKVIELAPRLGAAHTNLGALYGDMGRYADSERELKTALEIDPRSRAALNNLGAMLVYQHRDAEALGYYERARAIGPETYILMTNLGDSYRRTGQAPAAASAYRRGLELAENLLLRNVSDATARAFMGYFAARLGNRAMAERETGQAIGAAPLDGRVQRRACLTYEALGLRDKAIAVLQDAPRDLLGELSRHPDLEELRRDPSFVRLLEAGSR